MAVRVTDGVERVTEKLVEGAESGCRQGCFMNDF